MQTALVNRIYRFSGTADETTDTLSTILLFGSFLSLTVTEPEPGETPQNCSV